MKRKILAIYEAKKALKPYYRIGAVNKDEYKMVLEKSVKKV